MKLRVGLALASSIDDTNLIVIKAPESDAVLTCGGVPMVEKGSSAPAATPDPNQMNGTVLGKRYVDAEVTLEVLCTKAGDGSLALDGEPLSIAAPKALPASD